MFAYFYRKRKIIVLQSKSNLAMCFLNSIWITRCLLPCQNLQLYWSFSTMHRIRQDIILNILSSAFKLLLKKVIVYTKLCVKFRESNFQPLQRKGRCLIVHLGTSSTLPLLCFLDSAMKSMEVFSFFIAILAST